ncbi:hypothetical protein MRX96_033175 [Rhipicephalus microplus]
MALANEPSDAIARPGPSRMTDTRRQELESMDFQDSTAKSLSTTNETNGQKAETDSQNQADGAWQTVLTLRQKKALAKEKKAKSMDFSMTSYHQQTTSDDAPVLKKSKQVYSALDMNAGRKVGNPAAPTTSEQTRPAPAMHAASQLQATCAETPASQANATSTPLNSASQYSLANETHENEDLLGDLDAPRMELELASAKCRRDSDDGAQVDETPVKSEVQWRVVSGGKKRNAAQQRSSSLKRGDGRSN